jgi:3-deoxy-D-manno-octulosonate 8-phosphate phosphatase (KDO 8-P phosphatase)
VIDPEIGRRIRLLALDVDGVLTDNAIYLGPIAGERVELKRFHIGDGLGLGLLRGSPIEVAWLSGRSSEATLLRARELEIPTVIQAQKARKLPAMTALLEEKGMAWPELAYVADDLADLPILTRAGLPIAVANAVAEVKAVARWVTSTRGGEGAVREVIEALLRSRGEWEETLQRYLAVRGGP